MSLDVAGRNGRRLLRAVAGRPLSRVLHIVESLDRGAVENWLVRMMGHARKRGVDLDWTFYCTLDAPGALDEQAEDLGAKIIRSPVGLNQKLAFARALRRELKTGGYDVLHCHHDLVSGLYLAASAGLPIRRRIVHVHNADENVLTSSAWKAALYRPVLRGICLTMADRVVGISNHTLDTFLNVPRRPGRDIVHYYGVDPQPFEGPARDPAAFRQALEVPAETPLLLFGGRIVPEKNPVFAVEVLAALRKSLPHAVLIFAGAGSQEGAVLARARALGVADAIRMIGWRSDMASVMACADWFILPRPEHPMEGFGIAVVEAQLGGARLLLSRGVPDDPLLPSAAFKRLLLSEEPDAWAAAAVELLNCPTPSREAALAALKASPMDMDRALADLMALHA